MRVAACWSKFSTTAANQGCQLGAGRSTHVANVLAPLQGTFGTVLKCRNRESGDVVAIKKFKSRIDGEGADAASVRKTALREVTLLQRLRHQNIVTLLDVFRQGGKLYLCFEYLEKTGGDGSRERGRVASLACAACRRRGRCGIAAPVPLERGPHRVCCGSRWCGNDETCAQHTSMMSSGLWVLAIFQVAHHLPPPAPPAMPACHG